MPRLTLTAIVFLISETSRLHAWCQFIGSVNHSWHLSAKTCEPQSSWTLSAARDVFPQEEAGTGTAPVTAAALASAVSCPHLPWPHFLPSLLPLLIFSFSSLITWSSMGLWLTLTSSTLISYQTLQGFFCKLHLVMSRKYILAGRSHGQRSLAGYSLIGLQRVRHDWATKHASTHNLVLQATGFYSFHAFLLKFTWDWVRWSRRTCVRWISLSSCNQPHPRCWPAEGHLPGRGRVGVVSRPLGKPLLQGCSLQERHVQGRLGQPSTNHLAPPYSELTVYQLNLPRWTAVLIPFLKGLSDDVRWPWNPVRDSLSGRLVGFVWFPSESAGSCCRWFWSCHQILELPLGPVPWIPASPRSSVMSHKSVTIKCLLRIRHCGWPWEHKADTTPALLEFKSNGSAQSLRVISDSLQPHGP